MTDNLNITDLRKAIALLQKIADDVMADSAESLISVYVKTELSSDDPEAELTTEELWLRYQRLAQIGHVRACRYSTFTRELPRAMLQIHQIRRSTNLLREHRRVRGYRGICFRPSPQYAASADGDPADEAAVAGSPPPGA